MPPAAIPAAPAESFARLIDRLCRAVAARGGRGRLAGPLILLVWARLRRIAARFARLAARAQAGAPLAAPRRPASPRPGGPPPARLPRGFAWLVRLVPEAASGASQLQHLLAAPEMAELLAAAPQAGRLLRPLCRMLGVRPPPPARSLSSGRPQAGPVGPPPPVRPAAPSRPTVRPRPPPVAARPRVLTPPPVSRAPPVRA